MQNLCCQHTMQDTTWVSTAAVSCRSRSMQNLCCQQTMQGIVHTLTCVMRKTFMLRRLPSHLSGCRYSRYWWYSMVGGLVHTFAPLMQL